MTIQQYVQYVAWPNTQTRPIPVPDRDFTKIRMPDRYSYGFYFFEIIEETVLVDGEEVKLSSSRRNETPLYFYDPRVYTVEEYRAKKPDKNWKEYLRLVELRSWKKFMILRNGDISYYDGDRHLVHYPPS